MDTLFIKPILEIIAEYLAKYELLDWISINKINWEGLSKNPNDGAMDL